MKPGQTNKQQFWFVAKRGIAIWALFLEKLQTPFCSCWQWSQENSQSFKYTSCVFMLSSHTLSVSCACSGFSQHLLNYVGKYSISCRLCSLLKQLLISLFLKKKIMKYVVEERPFLESIRIFRYAILEEAPFDPSFSDSLCWSFIRVTSMWRDLLAAPGLVLQLFSVTLMFRKEEHIIVDSIYKA